jgi:ABC-type sugar transport system substrate-binding protein
MVRTMMLRGAVIAALAAIGALAAAALAAGAQADEAPSCPPPARALVYPDVEPIFRLRCASCHDARKSDNRAAQHVFEMSRYPFATGRPATLLADLRSMFIGRGSLSRTEKCAGIAWVDAGGRDASGKPPRWR